MKRYFSIVEEVRIQYECRATDEQELEIEKVGFQTWLEDTGLGEIFEVSTVATTDDYIDSDQTTILDED